MGAALHTLHAAADPAGAAAADAADQAMRRADRALAAAEWDALPTLIRRAGRVYCTLDQLRAVIAALASAANDLDSTGEWVGTDDVACHLDHAHDAIGKTFSTYDEVRAIPVGEATESDFGALMGFER